MYMDIMITGKSFELKINVFFFNFSVGLWP